MNKKGLSDIVLNVLIILFILVAVGIIWLFLGPIADTVSIPPSNETNDSIIDSNFSLDSQLRYFHPATDTLYTVRCAPIAENITWEQLGDLSTTGWYFTLCAMLESDHTLWQKYNESLKRYNLCYIVQNGSIGKCQ